MGLFKKKDDGDDSSRSALFSRNKSKSPAPPSSNPYAQAPPDAYTQAKMNAGLMPAQQGSSSRPQQSQGYGPPPQGGYGGNRYGNPDDKRQQPPPQQSGYGQTKFGNDQGYGGPSQGGNPYGRPQDNPYAAISQTSGASRTGGYGGLGQTDNAAPDADRNALFGGAADRAKQNQQNQPPGYQYNGGPDPNESRSYGAYGDRQLTAEEEEEEDITATKQEIKFMKQQDVSSTRNALQAAAMAEETGRGTLARLGAQGERIHNTDRNLDIGHNAINIAEDKSKELKTLNRSMFAVHMNNPFTAKEKRIRDEEKIIERHRLEREQREQTREAAFQQGARMNQNFKGLDNSARAGGGLPKASLAERSKYQFEADSDDDRMEDEIERNIDDLSGATKRLNLLARAMGEEADAQNQQLQKIADKSDRLDDRFHLQTERLKRIK